MCSMTIRAGPPITLKACSVMLGWLVKAPANANSRPPKIYQSRSCLTVIQAPVIVTFVTLDLSFHLPVTNLHGASQSNSDGTIG